MTFQIESIPVAAAAPAIPLAALDSLAARFRAAGLFVAMLGLDGSVAYHDPGAGAFFLRYVLPLLQRPALAAGAASALAELASAAAANQTAGHKLPGAWVATIPHIEKRRPVGTLLLAGRAENFSLEEDVLRVCSRLGLDGAWLTQQATILPAYNELALQGQGRVLLAAVRDQLRLCNLEEELASVSEQLAATYEELSLIYQVSGGMRVNRSAGDFFKQTCIEALQVIGVRGMGVALRPDTHRRSDPVLFGQASLPGGKLLRLAGDLIKAIQDRKGPILLNELNADAQFNWLWPHVRQLLAVPLQRQDQVLGCMFALDKNEGDFDSADSKLLNSIANESAIYLENSRLFEDMHGLMMGLMHSLTSAVDAKDPYTCGHSERVALLSRHLAHEAGLSDTEVEQVYMAGLLHDVGKIGVPESVLQKAGKLTAEEFDAMKKHPEIGARILQDVRQIKQIVPGVLHHHERFDGKGYPMGLSGQDIPLMGRIICLADGFDAMTSNRTYRRALPTEVALAEIRRCSGTHFDPALAEAFLRTSPDRYRELLRNHQERSKKLLDLPPARRPA